MTEGTDSKATAAKVTADQVREALTEVYDPEIPLNVLDLGLIYGIDISENNDVHVTMTLTAAGCGMGPFIAQQAEWAVAAVDDVNDVNVEIVFEPPWSPDLISEDGKKVLGMD